LGRERAKSFGQRHVIGDVPLLQPEIQTADEDGDGDESSKSQRIFSGMPP
jgi:hypothetical protein